MTRLHWGQTQLYYEGDLEADIEMMESKDYEDFSRQSEEHVQRLWVGMTICDTSGKRKEHREATSVANLLPSRPKFLPK